MTKHKLHKISIRNKNPNQILTGANCLLELDGKPFKGVTSLLLSVKANGVARIRVEMLADLETDFILGDLQMNFKSAKKRGKRWNSEDSK